ncbi:hypothetical protein [Mangrovimonas sp. YM274]|uniref:hypothetical protein n=1 Tax=Mangrovimonas sp. YM274 TaxID=3070660 RepID=UPI0027DBF1E6|nr:hypothetical protein [Mangrovimonas sp. YM274]WMI68177.1 hypothetical protein RBH95_13610 [Mangrovimonas sp. YM274]
MSTEIFKTKSELIENLPLTEKESQYFRPDLPMRFGRTKNVSWNSFNSDGIKDLKSDFGNRKFNATKIILVPYCPKGGFKKGEILECKSEFTEFEIILKAKEIQESSNNQKSNGIGFYRLGYQKGLPTYAIGEYFDRAGIMKN